MIRRRQPENPGQAITISADTLTFNGEFYIIVKAGKDFAKTGEKKWI